MITEILSPAIKFDGINEDKKFISQFTNLYGITIFKDGLDLILTKARHGDLTFEVKLIKGWKTNDGCCVTQENKIYNKFLNAFTKKLSHKIIIHNFSTNVIAHEMAHAIAAESGLALDEDFRKAIGFDMKNRTPENIALNGEVKRLMISDLKSYPANKILSELFARYFEILSICRDVEPNGKFTLSQVTDFFINTDKWIGEIFNHKIKEKIDRDIANFTAKLINENQFKSEKKFADGGKSFHKKLDSDGGKSWSKNVDSNSAWQSSWNKYQELEEKK
jgi:hypothetical protein